TVALQRLPKHLAHADQRGVERADVDRADLLYVVLGIEQHRAEVFLLKVTHLQHQELGDIGRRLDPRPRRVFGQEHAPCDLQRRQDRRGLGDTDAWLPTETRYIGAQQSGP